MDDRSLSLQVSTANSPQRSFVCPGHSQPIDRAQHLARLAAFYPACLQCSDRHDTAGLTTLQLNARADVERHATPGCSWSSEGLNWVSSETQHLEPFDRAVTAFGNLLWQQMPAERPTVVVGSDGGATAADLVSRGCRLLQLSGCLVLEAGATSSPALAAAGRSANGAVWIGCASGAPHAMSLRFWQQGDRPLSSPGSLDELRSLAQAGPTRARRGGGSVSRCDVEPLYLPAFASVFHGLRPLVIVLDTTCEPLLRYWQKLSGQSACRILRTHNAPHQLTSRSSPVTSEFRLQRLLAVSRQVVLEGAHFGLWISGDGEACTVVDELGEPVPAARLLWLLAQFVTRQQPDAVVVVAGDQVSELQRMATQLQVLPAINARQQLASTAEATAATLASDGQGRYWFAGSSTPDAFATLCLLLTLLSESDRSLSEVLDDLTPAK
jgi:phosphomannomutase